MNNDSKRKWGCPECGHNKAKFQQNMVQYMTEEIYCSFNSEDYDGHDVEDYGDSEYHDSEAGDREDYECEKCGHTFDAPDWCEMEAEDRIDAVFENSDTVMQQMDDTGIAIVEGVIEKYWESAGNIAVNDLAHAIMIECYPDKYTIREHKEPDRDMQKCTSCASGRDKLNHRTYDTGVKHHHHKPILVSLSLCKDCLYEPKPWEKR